ncbi:hypothetical protein ACFXGT_18660 [Streptomyces sp. NPDC059352]|uniref:hypothetical protein n=1 Tax=Streptomyces sp. NPDC059352 TaxID=3346810 RepID=UPI0036A63B17
MRNPIARVLGRALIPVLLGLLMLTLPATGRHRPRPVNHRRPAAPTPARRHRAPARRSPYAVEQTALLDGARSPLERPYLAADSARAVQRSAGGRCGWRRSGWTSTTATSTPGALDEPRRGEAVRVRRR